MPNNVFVITKKNRLYSLSDRLLPTNNWNNNLHLFIKDLEENEVDLISSFYSKAAYVDIVISKISDQKNDITTQVSNPSSDNKPTPPNYNSIISLSQSILDEISNNIELVFNTPTGQKMKKISQWHYFVSKHFRY